LTLLLSGCAGFSRGERWDDDDADTGSAADDDGDDGPADDDGSPTGGDDTGDADTGDTSAGSDGGPAGPSFATDVLVLLRAGCERCHAADGAANNTSFLLNADDDDAYASALEIVDLDDPASSRLLAKTAGKGHTGGVIYDEHSSEYATILDWIAHGAHP
jgi:hypothetical protein